MTKNVIGFVLSIAALFAAYSYLAGPQAENPKTSDENAAGAEGAASGTSDEGPVRSLPTGKTVELPPVPAEFAPEASAETLAIDTGDVSVAFAAKGGCIEGVTLKNYTTSIGASDTVKLIEKLEACKALGIKVGNEDLRESPARVTSDSPRSVMSEQRTETLHIRRVVEINEGGYGGRVVLEVSNIGESQVDTLVEMEIGATSTKDGASSFLSFNQAGLRHLAVHTEEDGLQESILNFEKTPASEVLYMNASIKPNWVASGGTYFFFALMPNFGDSIGLRFERQPYNMQPNRQSPPERTIYEGWIQHNVSLPSGSSRQWSYDLYAGPKALANLKAEGHHLDDAINYGFFRIVAWPMFQILHYIEKLVGNWGVAIIILTILIRILFYPLAAKSYQAGKKMQKLKPLMDEVREKYKDDKQKQQQEMMSLMAKQGVNPLGGCLPILPQIPVFFGLNAVLLHTFDLRQAPFALWITDLSNRDPYYISPIIMAALMYLQQKLIPMPSMEPAQAKMMRFLPVIFAVFMISYPSGLVLYIVTSTIFSIAQQKFMMSRHKEPS